MGRRGRSRREGQGGTKELRLAVDPAQPSPGLKEGSPRQCGEQQQQLLGVGRGAQRIHRDPSRLKTGQGAASRLSRDTGLGEPGGGPCLPRSPESGMCLLTA